MPHKQFLELALDRVGISCTMESGPIHACNTFTRNGGGAIREDFYEPYRTATTSQKQRFRSLIEHNFKCYQLHPHGSLHPLESMTDL